MPWDSVMLSKIITTPYEISGLTTTSQGHLAVVENSGSNAAIYSTDLIRMMDLTVVGAGTLWDITRRCDVLFMTDRSTTAKGVHVINETGKYSHHIPVTWQPRGIDIHINTLYVCANAENAVYKINLNETNQASSIVKVIMTPSNALNGPLYLHIYNNNMAIINYYLDNLILASLNGQEIWSYGQLGDPHGVHVDTYGRSIVADYWNQRVQLISTNGTFIQYILPNMEGRPMGLIIKGKTMFVSQYNPNKLYKYDIN